MYSKKIKFLIRQTLLTISTRDIIDEIDLKTLKTPPNFPKSAHDKKHFRDMEKQHSKKSKKLYNQGY